MTLPRILISSGEPAGIGPDITLLAAQQTYDADIIAMGDPDLFAERARQLKLDIIINPCSLDVAPHIHEPGVLKVLPIDLRTLCETGVLNQGNARYVLDVLDRGIVACQKGQADALVTGPIQKSILTHQVKNFTGHTEYLADKTQSPLPVMMLATEGLRVALVTTHMPLSEVPSHITTENVSQVLEILHHDLEKQFGINNPKILVAGLNPHAGEDGHLGMEEINIISPVIQKYQNQGMNLIGPLPADTLFTEKYLKDADAVLAMYHDQGLPTLKYKGFGNAINVTLGLPIVRTSVDHGTALDLAGTGQANAQSMILAIKTACEIVQ
jgi:4-hydroxythreonine-4-phosphate dehydrogenase